MSTVSLRRCFEVAYEVEIGGFKVESTHITASGAVCDLADGSTVYFPDQQIELNDGGCLAREELDDDAEPDEPRRDLRIEFFMSRPLLKEDL